MRQRAYAAVLVCLIGRFASADEPLSPSGPLNATLITLHLDQVPLVQALAELERASGIRLHVMPDSLFERGPLNERRVSFAATNRPWLECVIDLCRQADLNLQPDPVNNRFVISAPGGNRLLRAPITFAGPIAVACVAVSSESGVRYGEPAEFSQSADLTLAVLVEPPADVIGIDSIVGLIGATDDHGNALPLAPVPPRNSIAPWRQARLTVPLPSGGVRKLSSIQAVVAVHRVSRIVTLELHDVLNAGAESVAFAGGTCRVTDVATSEVRDRYDVTLKFNGAALPPRTFQNIRTITRQYAAVAGSAPVSIVNVLEEAGETTVVLRLPTDTTAPTGSAGRPVMPLIWKLPAEIIRQEVPVTLKDIPLWR